MAIKIIDSCFGCDEPVFEDEAHGYAIPRGAEWEELFHEECLPSGFLIQQDDVYGFNA